MMLLGRRFYSNNKELMTWVEKINRPPPTSSEEMEDAWPGLRHALMTATKELESNRVRAELFTVMNGKARAWPGPDFWHVGPSNEVPIASE